MKETKEGGGGEAAGNDNERPPSDGEGDEMDVEGRENGDGPREAKRIRVSEGGESAVGYDGSLMRNGEASPSDQLMGQLSAMARGLKSDSVDEGEEEDVEEEEEEEEEEDDADEFPDEGHRAESLEMEDLDDEEVERRRRFAAYGDGGGGDSSGSEEEEMEDD